MAKSLYDEVDGVYRKITKKYDGVEAVARNITKCYDSVDGVARQYFVSGVQWEKYNCTTGTKQTYTKAPSHALVGTTETKTMYGTKYTLSSYSWNGSSAGYGGASAGQLSATWEDAVGLYVVYETTNTSYTVGQRVGEITSVTYDGSKYTVTYKIVAFATITKSTTYSKGSTSYGTVEAPEGDLPEDGTLVKGSATGSYCVLEVDGTYYYYTKVS